jgi:hypothetical protein
MHVEKIERVIATSFLCPGQDAADFKAKYKTGYHP